MKKDPQTKDLQKHGVHDIIPKDEEYYTLDLTRNFDDDHDDDGPQIDIASTDPHNLDEFEEPPKSASIYDDGALTSGADTDPDASGEDGSSKNHVGDANHWGIDDKTG